MVPLLLFLAFIGAVGATPFAIAYLAARATEQENVNRNSPVGSQAIGVIGTLVRILIVLVSYYLSSYGLLLTVTLALGALLAPSFGTIMFIAWVYAWCCHAIMSIGWVVNRPVAKVWPISGTAAGLLSLLLPSVGVTTKAPTAMGLSVFDALAPMLIGPLSVLPCLLLAAYLVVFHLRNR